MCRSRESSWISVQFTTKTIEEVLDGTEHTWLEDTHPHSIFKKGNEKESMRARARAHTYAHRIDFALHRVIYYGTWQSLTNTHTHRVRLPSVICAAA